MRDFAIYIGVSVVVVLGIFFAATSAISTESFVRWYAFLMFSCLLLSQVILNSKRYWSQSSFWILTGILALGHTGAFAWVVRSGRVLGVWSWIVCVLTEFAMFMCVRAVVLGTSSSKRLESSPK